MRTKNSMINISCSMLGQFIYCIGQFCVRAILIRMLGIEYLGINGLFGNILTMLALAELGVGSAIVFSMYKPLAQNDEKKLKALMNLYAKAYRIIALVILCLGILLIPFLKYIIKDTPNVSENLIILYLLFLLNSLTTYFGAYKRSIIIADQKEYIVTIWTQVFLIISSLLQIIFLYLTRQFIVYLLIQIVLNLLTNFFLACRADKLYPLLKEKEKVQLEKEEKKNIFINIKALILYKIGNLLTVGVDNIIISSVMGIAWVGIYCNYTLIVDKLTQILSRIFTSMTASVGNLNTEDDLNKKEQIYKVFVYIAFWLFGMAGICIYVLINPFITLWIGKDYLLSEFTVLIITLNFYFNGIHNPTAVFKNAMGLYFQGRFASITGAAVNCMISILLVRTWGIVGVVFGTLMSNLMVLSWYEPYIVYKYGLNGNVKSYYIRYLYYALIFGVALILTRVCTVGLEQSTIGVLIVKLSISVVISGIVFMLATFKTIEFKYIWELANRILKRDNK